MMEPLSQVCTMTGEVGGMPSPELRKKLEAAGVTTYEPLQSLWPWMQMCTRPEGTCSTGTRVCYFTKPSWR